MTTVLDTQTVRQLCPPSIISARREADQLPEHSPADDDHRPAPELFVSLPEPDADQPAPATVTRITPLAPTDPLD